MMKYGLIFMLFFGLSASAQDSLERQVKENMAKLDSQTASMNAGFKETQRVMDSLSMARTTRQMASNLDAFMAERKEQERKNMQHMYWRIGFGLAMLAIFVIGIKRKKKQAA